MAEILIAEDSQTQAIAIQSMLENAGYVAHVVADGDAALEAVRSASPDILLTDMHMPGRNGLELTDVVRAEFPDVPVVLMTGDGTEELAAEALARGASNYIPKSLIDRELVSTIDGIAEMVKARHTRTSVLGALTHSEATYTFGNDRDFASALVSKFEADLQDIDFDDGTGTFRVVTALKEALMNAIEHGNLELDSGLREEGDGEAFHQLAEARMAQEPYRSRKVTVTARFSPEQLAYVIRDEGPGFDPSTLPDPTDPESMLRAHGRGLLLIRSFMDDVAFNDEGNQITLIKYRDSPTADSSALQESKQSLRILMAENSVTNQVLGRSLLKRAGHSVTVVNNGAEAVQISAEDAFDLILMDLEIPEMDGLAATREIRRREETTGTSVPIIAMTGPDGSGSVERWLHAGMQGHITKPIRAETLRSALSDL